MPKQIRVGDRFRDKRPPHGRWRVIAERNGVYELLSLDRPKVWRFHLASKLLDLHIYGTDE